MSLEQILMLILILLLLAFFAWDRLRYDVVAIMALIVAVFLGLVPSEAAFSGFAHPAVITVAMVLVISKGLINSGFIDRLNLSLKRLQGKGYVGLYVLLALTALTSAFINNVGALALFMPLAIKMARQNQHSPSHYLMPLAFASLLGGMMTLVGTPPNIIIATYRDDFTTQGAFGFFSFTPLGFLLTLGGLLVMSALALKVIPQRIQGDASQDLFDVAHYIMELRIHEHDKWVGERLAKLSSLSEELIVIALIRDGERLDNPRFSRVFKVNDRLIVRGSVEAVQELCDRSGFQLSGTDKVKTELLTDDAISTAEILVSNHSSLIQKTVMELNLRYIFGVNVLGIARAGNRLRGALKNIRFKAGDVVLLQGRFEAMQQVIKAYTLYPLVQRDLRIGKLSRLLGSLSIFGLAIVLAFLPWVSVPVAFTLGALLMVFFKYVPTKEVYSSIDFSVVVLLGALLPVSAAFTTTQTAEVIANALMNVGSAWPPFVLLAIVLMTTMALSNIINNAAAALVMAPIALSIALSLSVSPDAFLMATAIGASAAFLTPIGHQSSALVMGPGGYRFGDYAKLGLPLSVFIVIVGLPLLLWLWPL